MGEKTYAIQEFYEEKLFVERNYSGLQYSVMSQMHFHDGYEIWVSLSDGAKFYIEDQIYPVCIRRRYRGIGILSDILCRLCRNISQSMITETVRCFGHLSIVRWESLIVFSWRKSS